ncbi:MAG: glycosyltransferase family 4 protein [Candidatus Omnitrophica bacterium]|nr:glycosyltransferase family 4 protein [Candidatus Omnitrophota bacterium]
MKILILQRFDLSSVSCARRVLCQTEELLQRGHEVVLCDFPHEIRRNSIPALVNLEKMGAVIIPLDRRVHQYLRNLWILKNIQPQPDIIHLWKAYPDASLPAIALSRIKRIPLHYDWDDWEAGIAAELAGSSLAGWIAGRWDRLLPKICDAMTVASSFLRQQALAWGARPDRLWDAPVGADLERFHPCPFDDNLLKKLNLEKPVLVYSGQLEVASYAEQAVETLHIVQREIPTASLLVLGGGRKLDFIRKRAQELNLAQKIVFTDYIPADEIPRYLSLADVALAPFAENDVTRAKSPLKIAEYMAMGLPIAASDIGDVKIMAGEACAASPCGNAREMAQNVINILKSKDLQQKMSLAGKERARAVYNWKSHTDALEIAYHTAIQSRKKN